MSVCHCVMSSVILLLVSPRLHLILYRKPVYRDHSTANRSRQSVGPFLPALLPSCKRCRSIDWTVIMKYYLKHILYSVYSIIDSLQKTLSIYDGKSIIYATLQAWQVRRPTEGD